MSRRRCMFLVVVLVAALLSWLAFSASYWAGYIECGYYHGDHLGLSWATDESPCFWCESRCGPWRPMSPMQTARRSACCWAFDLYASKVIVHKYGVGGIVRLLKHRM